MNNYKMEYELFQFLNYLGTAIVFLIIGYHFLGIDDEKEAKVNS